MNWSSFVGTVLVMWVIAGSSPAGVVGVMTTAAEVFGIGVVVDVEVVVSSELLELEHPASEMATTRAAAAVHHRSRPR